MTNAERFELHMPMSRLHIEEWETLVKRDTQSKYISIQDLIDSITGMVDPKLYCADSKFLKVLNDCQILRASENEKEGFKVDVSKVATNFNDKEFLHIYTLLSKQALLTWGL